MGDDKTEADDGDAVDAASDDSKPAAPDVSAGAKLKAQAAPTVPLVPRDPLVREAYLKAFGRKAGGVSAGRGMGTGFWAKVLAPDGKPIEGYGESRVEALDNLIEILERIAGGG